MIGQGLEKICRDRRLGVCSIQRRQTGRRGATQTLLSLPRACQSSRLCRHPLRTLNTGRSHGQGRIIWQFDLRRSNQHGGARVIGVHPSGDGIVGLEQARLSAEDWLDESEQMESPQRATSRDWRAVTVAALARLATRGTSAEMIERLQHRPIRRFRRYYRPIVSHPRFWSDALLQPMHGPPFHSGTPVEIEVIFGVLSIQRTRGR